MVVVSILDQGDVRENDSKGCFEMGVDGAVWSADNLSVLEMKKTSRPPSQKDVAALAGVSQPVVSAVLTGRKSTIAVSEEVRAKVIDAVRKLAYRPNGMARSLQANRFFNIGYFVVSSEENDFDFEGYRRGIFDAANQADYHVMLVRQPYRAAPGGNAIPKVFREGHLDALVINNMKDMPHSLIKAVDASGLPVAFLNERREVNSVYVDEAEGMELAVDHLAKQGYSRLAFFKPKEHGDHYSLAEREKGIRASAKSRELSLEVVEYSPQTLSGDVSIFKQTDGPDAVICYNDDAALQLQKGLYGSGLAIGRDLAVVGCNADDFTKHFVVSLTTLRIPRYEMGVAATQLALKLFDMGYAAAELPSVVVKPTLVAGDSTPRKGRQSRPGVS
jgi:LacI family transcriptional regulator